MRTQRDVVASYLLFAFVALAGCAVGVSPSSGGGSVEEDDAGAGQTGASSYGDGTDAGSSTPSDAGSKSSKDSGSPASTTSSSASSDPSSVCAPPSTPADCTCASGHTCAANNCYGGYYCDTSTNRCKSPSSCP